MSRSVPHVVRTLAPSVVLVLIVGCGSDEPPSAAAPELADALREVDAALANGSFSRAEKALDRLIAEAEAAEAAGEISEADADEIVDAADELRARLPDPNVDPPEDTITPAPSETPPPADDEKDDEEKEREEDKDKEKDKDKEDKGNGKGHSSENGPDDGRGD